MTKPKIDPCLEAVLAGNYRTSLPAFVCEIEEREIGYVEIPSGEIVACDPLAFSHPVALQQRAPKGCFLVRLFIVHYENADQRIAAAKLEFGCGIPEWWEIALLPGQDQLKLEPNHYFGYPVDSGTGAFMDLQAAKELDRRLAVDTQYFQQIIEAMKENYVHTRDWAMIDVDKKDALNVAVFSSGEGDGLYASYWGWTEDGPLCLVTDFGLIYSEDLMEEVV